MLSRLAGLGVDNRHRTGRLWVECQQEKYSTPEGLQGKLRERERIPWSSLLHPGLGGAGKRLMRPTW